MTVKWGSGQNWMYALGCNPRYGGSSPSYPSNYMKGFCYGKA